MRQNVVSDHALARRLERTEAVANAHFVEARARLVPGSGARWIEVAGTYAMYDGAHSPFTQTFGLGMFQMPTTVDINELETFFKDRGAPVLHEVCPLADKALLPVLNKRGYQPVELSNVMFLPLYGGVSEAMESNRSLQVRVVSGADRDIWARTMAEGWREVFDVGDVMGVSAAREDVALFLVELNSQAIAAGALVIQDGVALLAGASTIPEWRRQGAQRALLESRLSHAKRANCDLAMVCAEPGSTSQHNAERQGFHIAYTRIKWSLMSS